MSFHCRKRALKQRHSRPQLPQRAIAALTSFLLAAALVVSFTVRAVAHMSGGRHAEHHSGTAAANPLARSGNRPAGNPGTQPSMPGICSGAGGIREAIKRIFLLWIVAHSSPRSLCIPLLARHVAREIYSMYWGCLHEKA